MEATKFLDPERRLFWLVVWDLSRQVERNGCQEVLLDVVVGKTSQTKVGTLSYDDRRCGRCTLLSIPSFPHTYVRRDRPHSSGTVASQSSVLR